MVLGPYDLSVATGYGFSPHGRYFGYIKDDAGVVSLDIYDLAACAATPLRYSLSAHPNGGEGDVAGWGFSPAPDDSRFMMAGSNPLPAITLVNLATKRTQMIAPPTGQAQFYFSPCGDLFGMKDVTSTPTSRDTFTLYRTRDFVAVQPSVSPIVETTSLYRDAWLSAAPQWHRIKRVRVADPDGTFEPEAAWPNLAPNTAGATTCQ
jgi:hypothetical protein